MTQAVASARSGPQFRNRTLGTDTIAFSIGGGGAQTITLTSALPVIIDAVVLDGSSQPGFGGTPLIEIDAGTTTAAVLKIRAGPANVHDLAVPTPHTAIRIHGVTNSTFANLDLSWTGAPLFNWSGTGLEIVVSSNNTISGNTATNRQFGIHISEGSASNLVSGNDVSYSVRGIEASTNPVTGLGNQYINNRLVEGGNPAWWNMTIVNDHLAVIKGNDFTDAATGIRLINLDGFTLNGADGNLRLNTVSHKALSLHNVTNSTFANLDLSWTGATRSGMGLAVGSSSNNTFTQVTASSRNTGIQISESSSNNVVRCAALLANGLGVDVSGIGSGNVVGESYIAGNVGAGLQNTSLQFVTAESNYWGAPDGPDPLGSGDTISGNVDVVPFLTQLPACLQDLQVEITSAPDDPVQIGVEISVEAAFTDGVTSGPHSAVWEWGDTSSSAGIVAEADGVGTVSGAYTYTASGVYTLTVTVTNDFGVVVSDVFEFIVVYDPEGGFVTGAGWIDSPAGAYTRDLTLEGRANFGFVSKYKRGASVPTEQTTFQFSVAGLHFRSTEYEWLVVAGARAQYKGSGTINGQGDYGFLLTALDGDINGGAGPDSFRIKIWDRATDQIVYDNQPEADDPGSAATELDGGSIVIHRG